jgi:hypothetical protein
MVMARKKHDFAQINMRIREDLRRKLEQLAKQQHSSLMNVIRRALEDSIDAETLRGINRLHKDLEIYVTRMANNLMQHEDRLARAITLHLLEDQLAAALEQGYHAQAITLLKKWLLQRRSQCNLQHAALLEQEH